MTAIWVEITATRGSAPRDASTAMMVTATGASGTIGGGALEFQAIAKARQMLAAGETDHSETVPLGARLGQCCGGSVSLRFGSEARATDMDYFAPNKANPMPTHPAHLWIWGAGHVGRAVVNAGYNQALQMTWIDSSADRFPPKPFTATGRTEAKRIPAADMPLLATRAERQADHLVFTYSHDIDLALCAALLKRQVRSIGLIGSDTKWARFQKRLRQMGLDPAPITCPIGDKSLGKRPDQIAQCVIAGLRSQPDMKATG
jgi:xanthine dehydrogenase accessory factor